MIGRRSPGGFGVALLLLQLTQVGFDRIPPVTLVTIVVNSLVFLRLPILNIHYPTLHEVCISVITTWYRQDWKRVVLAAYFHGDDWHLYYNMISFLWKGISLEKRLGSLFFVYMIAVFTILTNVVLLGLNMAAEYVLHDQRYLADCAVGFSGVLFALKVVTTHYLPPGVTYVMGFIPVHSRLACWVELVLIQVIVPNASFTGHLAGILVGLLYVKGPLRTIMNIFNLQPSQDTSYTYTAGSSGYRTAHDSRYSTRFTTSPHRRQDEDLTGGASEDEQLHEAIRRSQAGQQPRGVGTADNEEVRKRRLARLDR